MTSGQTPEEDLGDLVLEMVAWWQARPRCPFCNLPTWMHFLGAGAPRHLRHTVERVRDCLAYRLAMAVSRELAQQQAHKAHGPTHRS